MLDVKRICRGPLMKKHSVINVAELSSSDSVSRLGEEWDEDTAPGAKEKYERKLTRGSKLQPTPREQGRFTLSRIAKALSSDSRSVSIKDLRGALSAGTLRYYLPGEQLPCIDYKKTNFNFSLKGIEEIFWKDINKWIEIYRPKIKIRFHSPKQKTLNRDLDTNGDIDTAIEKTELAETASTIADRIAAKLWATGIGQINPNNISQSVAEELAKDSTTWGQRGPLSANTVRLKYLKGWHFVPPLCNSGN